ASMADNKQILSNGEIMRDAYAYVLAGRIS
ncbi:MAG: hypothetical protein JWM08_1736, partial [Candidatus Angelobacter sp.]|nr:hypothetical protein [Candidatus Angelobacter sp.]